jgi:hypothetical protein
MHRNGEYSLCRSADGEHRCKQMLYCLYIPIPAQWRRGPLSRIKKRLKTRMNGRPTETPEELLNELLPYVEKA